ncbi:hypothetical protein [Pseudoalteromonas ruthenica]|uniref:hypothetical protein n=1 Tax=Pseudoalteromonas ruthenica TaxID=151081 RepID=UPI001486DD61|nr:hypothetical protein [Pseudoalteromonas ruthenica]
MSDKNELEKQLKEANKKIAYLKKEIVHVLCRLEDSPDSVEAAKDHLRYLADS